MESLRQFSADDCIEEGCTSVALNSKYCLFHGNKQRQAQNGHSQSNVLSVAGGLPRSGSGSGSRKSVVKQDSPKQSGRTRAEEHSQGDQSRRWRRSSCEEPNHASSTSSQAAVKKSNLPPGLVGRIALTARKSTYEPVLSKRRTEMMSSSFQTKSTGTHTGGSCSPSNHQRPVSGAFNPFQSFINPAHTPSPNITKRFNNKSPYNTPKNTAAATEEQSQGQGQATLGGYSSEISPSTSPVTQTAQSSQRFMVRSNTNKGAPVASDLNNQPALGGHSGGSTAKNPGLTPTPSGSRSFDSLPCVRTNRLPPMQIKSAPSALRSASAKPAISSASKRKRDISSEPSSQSSSSDETDDDVQIPPRMHVSGTAYDEAQTNATTSGTQQRFNWGLNVHADVSRTQRQWNGINILRTGAALSPIVLSSSSGEDEGNGMAINGDIWQPNSINVQNHQPTLSADGQYFSNGSRRMIIGVGNRQWTEPDQRPKKLSCEERRLQLCANFDSAKFDAMVYGQAGATSPPSGVSVPAAPINGSTIAQSSHEHREQLYLRLDPRIHWPHNRSDQWYKLKMDDIKARGGRKANFGKVAQRMRQQRLEEEKRGEEERRAVERGVPVSITRPPQPWSHHRHMDFGDVPEGELPAFVRKNPEWLQATAWMRENRAQNLRRNKEAAALRAAGRPWEHLFPRSGR